MRSGCLVVLLLLVMRLALLYALAQTFTAVGICFVMLSGAQAAFNAPVETGVQQYTL